MPKVGKKSFPYTPLGVMQAKAYARKTGQKVKMTPAQSKAGAVKGRARRRGQG